MSAADASDSYSITAVNIYYIHDMYMRVKWITHNGQTVYHKPKKDYVMYI